MIARPRTVERAERGAQAPASVRCDHCGLPVPRGLFDEGAELQFCCNACRTAYDVIHACGLTRYYDLAQAAGEPAQRAKGAGRKYEEFDDPKFRELYARSVGPGVESVDLLVEGIHCAACVWLLERLPLVSDGVLEARVNIHRSTLSLRFRAGDASLSAVARFVDSLGYALFPARGGRLEEIRVREDRAQLVRIGVAGAIAGNVMLLALALYAAEFSWIDASLESFFRLVSAGLAAISLAWPGAVFFRGALASLRTRAPHMDVPIAIGLATGGIAGTVNALRGSGEIYFDTITILVFLLLLGRWIQARQQRRSADAVEMLYALTPTSARLVEGNLSRDVPVEALQPGDVVEVAPGETVPVDGEVVLGESALDESLLSGESRPVPIGPGEKAPAGATVMTSPIRVRVEATGERTRVGRLMGLVERAAAERPPIVRLADRLAAWFVGIVLSLASLTFLGWVFVDPESAVANTTALLIVTCPCALGLATPLAIIASIGRAARRGILVKGGDALESLARPGVLVLDKTGTITEGRMRVTEWVGPDDLKPVVGAIESRCAHPIAAALASAYAEERGPSPELAVTVGAGVQATLDGATYRIGSRAFLERAGDAIPADLAAAARAAAGAGHTPVLVSRDGLAVALATIADEPRDDAASTIDALAEAGWEVRVLSGDHPDAVRAVGARVGLDPDRCEGGASPERKLEAVRAMAATGRTVVMVGDGVNDAAALSAATVGVAVHGGAEVAMNVADVYIARAGLAPLRELVVGARRTRGIIRRNLGASLGYNAVTATLAISGMLNPLLAAVLMPASSLTVVLLSYRSRSFEKTPCR